MANIEFLTYVRQWLPEAHVEEDSEALSRFNRKVIGRTWTIKASHVFRGGEQLCFYNLFAIVGPISC